MPLMTITQVESVALESERNENFDRYDVFNRIETIMVDIEIAWIIKLRK